jgi:hypothetical protein
MIHPPFQISPSPLVFSWIFEVCLKAFTALLLLLPIRSLPNAQIQAEFELYLRTRAVPHNLTSMKYTLSVGRSEPVTSILELGEVETSE